MTSAGAASLAGAVLPRTAFCSTTVVAKARPPIPASRTEGARPPAVVAEGAAALGLEVDAGS